MTQHGSVIDAMPAPQTVAAQLGDAMREVSILKKLLKAAKAVEQERQNLARASSRHQAREAVHVG